MPLPGSGLTFFPIYHVHHDGWTYREGNFQSETKYHYGHTHLFHLGYDWMAEGQDTFFGQQNFTFEIKDVWGPRSDDPNQQHQYRVIGTPKWYWHIEEVWRRMYIQRWDERINTGDETELLALGRRGIRWDASHSDHRKGPFREGAKYSPMFMTAGGRTLPIEYYTNEDKQKINRDNRVKALAQGMTEEWNAGPLAHRFPKAFVGSQWDMTHGSHKGDFTKDPTWPDALYIHPIMEYRKVIQLNWQRWPGHEAAHDIDENNFGDGWNNMGMIPFINPATMQYNSPFGPAPGVVMPFGEYFGVDQEGNPLVPLNQRPKHRKRIDYPPQPLANPPLPGGYDFEWEPFGLPAFTPNDPAWNGTPTYPAYEPINNDPRENLSEQPFTWHNPYSSVSDGKWVQQCIGGIVRVKAVVTLEHKLGGRHEQTIGAVQLLNNTPFSGKDQQEIESGSPQMISLPGVGNFFPGKITENHLSDL